MGNAKSAPTALTAQTKKAILQSRLTACRTDQTLYMTGGFQCKRYLLESDLLSDSLSVIVPVRNAACSLRSRVVGLLETAADLTENFEIIIADGMSTDQTEEAGYELAREFPQVKVIRDSTSQLEDAALQCGIAEATGDVVLVQEISQVASGSKLRQQWEMRNDQRVVMGDFSEILLPSSPRHEERIDHLESRRQTKQNQGSSLNKVGASNTQMNADTKEALRRPKMLIRPCHNHHLQ